MKTEKLISELSESLKPIEPLQSPSVRFLKWFAFAVLSLLTGIAIMGVREDVGLILNKQEFIYQSIILSVMAIASAISAFLLNVPEKKSKYVLLIPWLTLISWVGLLIFYFFNTYSANAGSGLACIRDIMVLGALPGVLLFFMLRKGAPFKLGLSGILGVLAVASLGAFGTQFICSNEDPLHILTWHFLPVVILSILGYLIGVALLRWSR